MMSDMSMMSMCVMMFFAVVFFIAFIGVTVYLVIRLLIKKNKEDGPIMTVKQRYAEGDIDEEELNKTLESLRKHQ